MIIIKPILYNIIPFDANYDYEINFVYNGNQVFGNICNIYNNVSGQQIYHSQIDSMQCKHIIPANSLQNGIQYYVRIAVIDKDDNISDYSDALLFTCYTTPSLTVQNFPIDQYGHNVIRNSSYDVSFVYIQNENEPLQFYEIEVYDIDMDIVQTSNIQYNTSNIHYVMTDLEDNKRYYLKAKGSTLHNIVVESELYEFSVNYIQPSIYSVIALENLPQSGMIKIQSNIIALECTTDKTPQYIGGKYIDLRDNVLHIDKDFSLDDDFIIMFSGYDFSEGLLMELSDYNSNVYLYLRKKDTSIYLSLEIITKSMKYIIFSNSLNNVADNELLQAYIKKDKGLYSVGLIDLLREVQL